MHVFGALCWYVDWTPVFSGMYNLNPYKLWYVEFLDTVSRALYVQ